MRTSRRLIAFSCCAAALAGARPTAQQGPTFTATSAGVTVPVVVRNGLQPVPGLLSVDFVLTDNGVPQTVVAEHVESLPLDVTLALDVSTSATSLIEAFKDDVRNIAKLLRPTDRLRLLSFDSEVRELFPFTPATARLSLDGLTPGRSTALFDGMLFAMARAPNPDRLHLVVVFTDGGELDSLMSGKAVADAAARCDGVLDVALTAKQDHVPGVVEGGTINGGSGRGTAVSVWRPVLRAATEVTGGQVYDANESSSLKKTFTGLFDDFHRSYVLRYSATGVTASGWHEIVVTVPTHAGYHVQARRGYFGG